MTPEQQSYYNAQLKEIRSGGYGHCAYALQSVSGMGFKSLGPVDPPVVGFGQDGDSYFQQYLQNWAEVNALIADLKAEATKAWGEETTLDSGAAGPSCDPADWSGQGKPYADKALLSNDRMSIDPETGNVSIGTPPSKRQPLKRATIADAPDCLNINDKAMWVIGWSECVEAHDIGDKT